MAVSDILMLRFLFLFLSMKVLTAMAFKLFAQQNVDIAVIEVSSSFIISFIISKRAYKVIRTTFKCFHINGMFVGSAKMIFWGLYNNANFIFIKWNRLDWGVRVMQQMLFVALVLRHQLLLR